MVKKILVILAVAVVGLVVVILTRPATYHVQRSVRIEAPRPAVFATVADLREFPKWSPWQKVDPSMNVTVSDPPSGEGATYAWQGNDKAGKGRMTVTEHVPPERTVLRLEFLEPFASVATTGFTLVPDGPSATTVGWWMDGHNGFMGKAFSLFMSFDEMLGKDFEEGLANLKRLVEASAPSGAPAPAVE